MSKETAKTVAIAVLTILQALTQVGVMPTASSPAPAPCPPAASAHP